MSEVRQTYDDEIDLFELFQTLWDGKWLISAFVAMAVLFGGLFLSLQDTIYESKLVYSADTIPPFLDGNKASNDFQKKFYSKTVFEDWKRNDGNVSLAFDDFSVTESVDGVLLTASGAGRLATFSGSSVLIKSNQLPILDDFFRYCDHINELLTKGYLVRADEELKMIGSRFDDLVTNDIIVQNVLSIDRYIASTNKGASAFVIQRPTMPKVVSQRAPKILAVSVVLGGIIGVFFTLVLNAVKKRKEQLAKA